MADIPGDMSTTSTIGVGGTVTSSLDFTGDRDWFKIDLTAGQTVVITLDGSGASALVDPYLYLHDSSGKVISQNDDSGGTRNSTIAFSVTTSGTYYIDAGAWNDNYTGSYTLSVQPYTAPPVWNYDQIANQLVNGWWNWNGEGAHHFNVSQGGTITVNITGLTADEQTLARAALAEWHDIIGVNFKEVTLGGQILFTDEEDSTAGGQPSAYTEDTSSGGITSSAHVHISHSWVTNFGETLPSGGQSLDSYAFQTYIHEIGHALGLGHAGDYNGDAAYGSDALFANDSWATSIMSYFSQTDNFYTGNQGFTEDYVLTPMIADIVAMQQIYGLSTTTRTGNTTYGFHSTADRDVFNANIYPDAAYTIYDSGGVDTLDYSGFSNDQLINLNPETFSNVGADIGNVSIGRGVVIENAIGGSGNDTLIGNGVANVLTGNAGDDTLNGGAGADTMIGGTGNDTYVVDDSHDVVTENAGEGADLVNASVTFTLGANVENLTFTGSAATYGTGNALDNVITGNDAVNVLRGGGGNDTLIGNGGNDRLDGGAGADIMSGGLGNDVFYVDNVGDAVSENAGQGTDLVEASVSYVLGANLERLTLTGSAAIDGAGNELNNVIRGNNAANAIDGGDGNDILAGYGGNDTLTGGAGNDRLYGNAGSDTMAGGAGTDAYYVDNVGDVVTENAGEGTDTVVSTISYSLGANVERLVLSGSAAIDGTGNSLDNKITGNAGANVIHGGAGNDTLVGGAGADTLIGDTGKDTLTGGTGNDTFVFSDGDISSDRITDFTSGQDKIDLSGVDANTLLSGDQGFTFIGTGAFSDTAGELRYEQISGNTYVSGDMNGDGIADFLIKLDGLHTLNGTDFVP